ncbi:MAG: hypothetical protein AAGA30_06635, partial [Planctomycetota bacterium]
TEPHFSQLNFLNHAEKNLALDCWNIAHQILTENAPQVATLLNELEIHVLESKSVAPIRFEIATQIIKNHPHLWSEIKLTIKNSIGESNQKQLRKWESLSDSSENASLRLFISDNLVARQTNLTNRDVEPEDAAVSNSSATTAESNEVEKARVVKQLSELIERRFAIEVEEVDSHLPNLKLKQVPEVTFFISRLNNFLISQVNRTPSTAWSTQQLEKIPTWPADISNGKDYSLSPSEQRKWNLACYKLVDDKSSSSTRISAMKVIGELASSAKTIEYSQAKSIAEYFVVATSSDERLAIDRWLPRLSHLVQLHMAILDFSTVSPEMENRIRELLLRLMPSEHSKLANDAIGTLRQAATKQIFQQLEEQLNAELAEPWNYFRREYSKTLSRRVQLLSNSTTADGPMTWPKTVLNIPHNEIASIRSLHLLLRDDQLNDLDQIAIANFIYGLTLSLDLKLNPPLSKFHDINFQGQGIFCSELFLLRSLLHFQENGGHQ